MSLKKIGVVGVGNVGSALVMEMSKIQGLAEAIEVAARNPDHAQVAILDAGAANPEAAQVFSAVTDLDGEYDVVVVTAGILPHGGITSSQLADENLKITKNSLEKVSAKTVVVIGTPVDIVAERLAHDKQLGDTQVIGFGGELDRSRAIYSLLKRGHKANDVYAIGEHGPRTIPTYPSEADFEDVMQETGAFLKNVMASVEVLRNLATGTQLARLVAALSGQEAVHCISVVDSDFDEASITWPYRVSAAGLEKLDIPVGPKAQKALDNLVSIKKTDA